MNWNIKFWIKETKFNSEFETDKDKDTYVVKGDVVEKLFKMTNFNTEEALMRFSMKLRVLLKNLKLTALN